MKPEITGIIRFHDIIDPLIYIDLSNDFKSNFKRLIKKEFKSYSNFARKINIPLDVLSRNNYLLHFFEGHKISTTFFIKLLSPFSSQFTEDYIESNITRIGCKRGSGDIINPKIPFNYKTPDGVKFISALLHDGGISTNYQPNYRNSEKIMVNAVINAAKNVFGEFPFRVRDTIVFFPVVIGRIINKLGMKNGMKVATNPRVPNFVFNLSDNLRSIFLRQAFDDDGHVGENPRAISIGFNILKLKNKIPQLLIDNKRLLQSFGIRTGRIHPVREYKKEDGSITKRYVFLITGRKELEKFQELINFDIKYKKLSLESSLKSYKCYQTKQNETFNNAVEAAKKLSVKGSFSIKELSEKINRVYGHAKKLIYRMEKQGLVKRVKNTKRSYPVKFKFIDTAKS